MADIIVTANLIELTRIGLRKIFLNEYNAPGAVWNKIFPEETSDLPLEQELIMAGFGPIAAWNSDGGGISYDKPISGDRVLFSHNDFAIGWILTHKMLRDDLYKKTGKDLVQAAALSVRHTVEQDVANIFNGGFADVGPDGESLFSTDHPLLGGGVQANTFAAPAALDATSLQAALIAFMRMRNHRGQPIMLEAAKLVVPPELYYTAKELINNTLSPETIFNSTPEPVAPRNTQNVLQGAVSEIIPWRYLTDTANWFLVAPTNQTKLRYFWRERPKYDLGDKDFDTKGIANSVNYANSVGYTAYDGVFGVDGA